jgi:hypothetical protein
VEDSCKCGTFIKRLKIKVKFALEQTIKSQKKAEVKLYSVFNLSARWE